MDLLGELAGIDEGLAMVMMHIRKSVRAAMREAKQDEKDRRVIHLLLLPKAEKTIEKLNIIRREFMSKLCEGITREEADAFMVIVRKMAGNVQKNIPD